MNWTLVRAKNDQRFRCIRKAMASAQTVAAGDASAQHLKRTLTLRDLILYGIIVIQPLAPMPVFGVLYERRQGHAVTTLLIALRAVLLTAVSYGRMARAYPSAGSAVTYDRHGVDPDR